MGPIEKEMREALVREFQPLEIEIVNESSLHAGHRPPEETHGESHFRLLMVSKVFEGLSRVERSRRVHELLKDQLQGPVHALSLKLMSPTERKG